MQIPRCLEADGTLHLCGRRMERGFSCRLKLEAAFPLRQMGVFFLILLAFGGLRSVARAAPAQQDPLMSLMLSQPKIDVESPVTPMAFFDPPIVRPGELVIYRISMNALEESVEL